MSITKTTNSTPTKVCEICKGSHSKSKCPHQSAPQTKTRAIVKHIEPAEFVKALYKHDKNATQAIKELQPELTESSARNKGHRMLTNANVAPLIEKMENLIEQGAYKGLKRANQLIESDDEKVATTNIWKLVEHQRGTPIQRQQLQSTSVNLNLDLTSITQEQQK